jgi:hypothetical protein
MPRKAEVAERVVQALEAADSSVASLPASASEDIVVVFQSTACGHGEVTATCPFNNHTWDSQWIGRDIVELKLPNVGSNICIGADGSPYTEAAVENCVNYSVTSVQSPMYDYLFQPYINIAETNVAGISRVQALTASSTIGDRVTVKTWNAGVLQAWQPCPNSESCFTT